MHATRRRIIEVLKEKGEATVDELTAEVDLTPMAVRYHLNVLQAENLIHTSAVRRQNGPGRPQQIYQLTEAADEYFPEDYHGLTDYLLDQLEPKLGKKGMTELFTSIAERMASEAPKLKPGQTFEERLDDLVAFLRDRGFGVDWERQGGDYMIHAHSCPYRQVVKNHEQVCMLDHHIIASMLQTEPDRIACLIDDDQHCTYRVSAPIELVLEPA